MARRIYKYEVPIQDEFALALPGGARIVRFAPQTSSPPNTLYIWALIDTDRENYTRRFGIRGTGHELGPDDNYVASCEDGPFVWHLVEDIPF